MTTNVIPFKPKQKPTQELTGIIEHSVLEDGSIWWRVKWEDQKEWSEWEKLDEN